MTEGKRKASRKSRRTGDQRPDPEMWEALGRGRLLREILEDFYSRVFADDRLAPFFRNVTRDWAIGKQYSFLAAKFSDEDLYFGDRPRNAHHWMVISNELFDYRERLMEDCLRKVGLAEHLIMRWLALENAFRKQIVKAKPIPRKLRGVALPLEGYERDQLVIGSLCDECSREMPAGETVVYHVRSGKTYCSACGPAREAGGRRDA